MRPARTQISLGIRPVWSESSLCAQWVANDPRFFHADSKDWSDWVCHVEMLVLSCGGSFSSSNSSNMINQERKKSFSAIMKVMVYQILKIILQSNNVQNIFTSYLSQLMRLWYFSHRQPVKAQATLRICAVSPEPLLFAHMKYGSIQRVKPKISHLASLDGCACGFEEWIYGGQKVPKSHEFSHFIFFRFYLNVP